MATPSDYKTGTVEIGVNTYSKPVNTAAIEAVGDVLDIAGKTEKLNRVEKFAQQERTAQANVEAELLAADKGIGLFARGARLQQESLSRKLTEDEARTLGEYQRASTTMNEAYAQGKVSYRQYLLDAQTRLRSAITARPDLADQFRKMSVQELGVDVGNAAISIWQEDMEYLKAAGQDKTSSVKPSDVISLAKSYEDNLIKSGSPLAYQFSLGLREVYQTANSDPVRANGILEGLMLSMRQKDPEVNITESVNKVMAGVDTVDQTITNFSIGFKAEPTAFIGPNGAARFETFKTQVAQQKKNLLEYRATLSNALNTRAGEAAQKGIERIDQLLKIVGEQEDITPDQIPEMARKAEIAGSNFADRAVSTRVALVTSPKTTPENGTITVSIAGAGTSGINSATGTIPYNYSGVLSNPASVGIAIDAVTSNGIGSSNPLMTITGFKQMLPDAVVTLDDIANSMYFPYESGQRNPDGTMQNSVISVNGFFSTRIGSLYKLARATTATDEQPTAGNGYLDDIIKYGTPDQKYGTVVAVAKALSGANISAWNDLYHRLPAELREEFTKVYFATDVFEQVRSGANFTKIPPQLDRYMDNGKKREPSPALRDAVNKYSTTFANTYKDGLNSYKVLAGFVVRNSATKPKPAK